MKPILLVLTPTLGNRPTLKRTLESVASIGGQRVHHVVICPESKIAAIKSDYGNIDCLAEPEGSRGIYAALNYGFRKLGNDYRYLTYINDDDYWLPEFAELIRLVENDESIELAYGKTLHVSSDNEVIRTQACSGQFPQFITLLEKKIVLFTQQATLLKRDVFFKIGGFDERYKLVSDTKLWAQASLMGIRYRYYDKPLAAYMLQEGQLSSDSELQDREHQLLLSELGRPAKVDRFAVLKFRLVNTVLYLQRLLSVFHRCRTKNW